MYKKNILLFIIIGGLFVRGLFVRGLLSGGFCPVPVRGVEQFNTA